MLETNVHVHVHVFTADHSPEIQFFYMLWNVFEGIFVRRGVSAPWPVRTIRFTIEELAAYRLRVELALRAAKLFRLGSTFDEALRGLVRTVEAMTHGPEAAILSLLGMPGGISGQDFLGFLLERLGSMNQGNRFWVESRGRWGGLCAACAGAR